ncbi:MAG TPA: phage holin family protein [Blastocatellia bacterium]|nr:phage holin family protein [Blastocatellia bacterium]
MQVRRGVRREEAVSGEESFGDLLSQLANNSAALVRDEIALAKQEMGEKAVRLRSGAMITALGSAVGLLGVLALTAAIIIGLGHLIGYGWSALVIGIVLSLAGGVTASVGIGRIKRTNLKPEQTIETLEEDKQWLKELT